MDTFPVVAVCTFGLEAVVVRELRDLGYDDAVTRSTGRVVFEGDPLAVAIANIHLRVADRILIEAGRFEATDFGVLYDQVHALPWEHWLSPRSAFPVNGRSVKSQLSSVPACQKIVKKAIVDKLMAVHGVTLLPENGPRTTVEISMLEDIASITLDTTGAGLHQRGYRNPAIATPLHETLAAALVMLSTWQPDQPLIDPFCGSGLIAIEAAMLRRRIAPGLYRAFDAEAWGCFDASIWSSVRERAARRILPADGDRIVATDSDARALGLARRQAEHAGVADSIHFQQIDFSDLHSRREYGCVITSPPYREKSQDRAEGAALLEQLPLVLRRLPTWSHYILTSYQGFEDLLGQKAHRRRKLYSNQTECTYYQFVGPKRPEDHRQASGDVLTVVGRDVPAWSSEAMPVFGGLGDKAHDQAEIFTNRLKKMARHLRRWPTRRDIHCFRLYDRDIPEVPLVVDRYEDHLHMAEHERPHERSAAQHADWLDLMMKTAAAALGIPIEQVFLKRRGRQRGLDQYEKADERQYIQFVREGGLRFEVNLSDYIDTGLFLDHRQTRAMFRERAQGKDVLNLFCYTGAFSVYAAAGGAKSTTSVDLSNTYLNWAQRNLEINDLAGPTHRQVKSDIFKFFEHSPAEPQYDLAVVDPPTFSNSKSNEDVWDVQRDHAVLLTSTLKRLRPGGELFFSTNSRRFKLDEAAVAGTACEEITTKTIPEDFRNKRIHRCWLIRKP